MRDTNEEKVAIIIPFYKGIGWLEDALASVANQSYTNYYVFVINDGSLEDMSDLRHYVAPDKISIINQQNRGAAAARNRGIDLAKDYTYVAFLDSDDMWHPDKLRIQLNYLKENVQYKWCHCFYQKVNIDRSVNIPTHKNFYEGSIFFKSLMSCTIATPAVLIFRRILDNKNLRFEEGLKSGEDTLFWLKLLREYPIGLVDQILVYVRMRGENAATDIHAQVDGRNAIYNFLKENNNNSLPYRLVFIAYRYINIISSIKIPDLMLKILYFPVWLIFKLLVNIL